MVTLRNGETAIRSGSVVVYTKTGPCPGILTVTNHALVLLVTGAPPPQGDGWGDPSGAANNEYRIGLQRVRQAVGGSGPSGPVLQVNLLVRVLYIQIDDIPGWAAAVNAARANAPPPSPNAGGGGPIRGGGAPRQPRCSYCGRLSPAGSIKCISCGAPF